MKIVKNEEKRIILGGSVKVLDHLDPLIYSLNFSKFEGSFLMEKRDFFRKEKMYGKMQDKSKKIFRAFENREGNLGILLSGDKGLGKSMFMRMVAKEALERGFPVICVDDNLPGLKDFISSVEEPAVFLFDEFEKVFHSADEDENNLEDMEKDSQNQFLSILDGTGSNHHIFIVTCNSTDRLSSYFLNRPGRFYYHFSFYNPSKEIIEEYLADNLLPEFSEVKDKILAFSEFGCLNYDSLKAITQEINSGYSFEESLDDLNVGNKESISFSIEAVTEDGEIFHGECYNVRFDRRTEVLANMEPENQNFIKDNDGSWYAFTLSFNIFNLRFSRENKEIEIPVSEFGAVKYCSSCQGHRKGEKVVFSSVKVKKTFSRADFGGFMSKLV